ncbi:unnamed protein product [Cladocopium goreaui]|uniref:FAD synthase n=1 Tax=Cladocopium goreaui TaxID=2562237 RepID=A0A9P1FUH0_9DINO|nr:unnamed protein product [Cladocopium goreaui]
MALGLQFPAVVPMEGAFQVLPRNCATCLGKFDALHLGHASLVRCAEEMNLEPWMVSFSGMAKVFGWPERSPLIAPEHRQEVLASLGKSGAKERVLPFAEVRGLSPKDFVDFLVDVLGAEGAVCGENFRFGFKAAGDAAMLKELGRTRGIPVTIAPLCCDQGRTISSSRLREMLKAGQMEEAATILGRPHRVLWRSRKDAKDGIDSIDSIDSIQLLEPANQIPGDGSYKVSVLQKGHASPAKLKISEGAAFLSKLPGTELGADILFDEGLAAQQQLPR